MVLYKGKVEFQKMRRHMKEQAWRDISIWTSTSNRAVASRIYPDVPCSVATEGEISRGLVAMIISEFSDISL